MTPPDGMLLDLPPASRRPGERRRPPRLSVPRGAPGRRPWRLSETINVVLFAGLGGTCQGLDAAGFPVHVALNHDRIAVAAHRAMHPHTKHLQVDVYEACPLKETAGKRVGHLWASPDCRDHSVAKGGAPRSPRVRSMPWQICRWVGVLRKRGLGPEVVYLENVREIRGWGPLIAKRCKLTGRVVKTDGTVAAKGERVPVREQQLVRDPKRVGRTYRRWVRHMIGLGAWYEDRDLCCGDYGVATTRTRLFGVGRFDGQAPRWPVQTHAHRRSAAVLEGRLLPHVPAAAIIDWSIEIPSIFDRKKDLVAATQRRIAIGTKRFVIEAQRPFLVQLTHSGGPRVHDVEEGLRTITTAQRGEIAVVSPHVAVWRGTSSGVDGRNALPTVTANSFHKRPGGAGPLGVVAAHLTRYHGERRPGEDARGGDLEDSLPTATVENRFGVVAATMIQTGYGERPGQDPRCLDVEDAIGTQVAGGAKHAIVGAWMVKHSSDVIGLPMEDGLSSVVTKVGPQAVGAAYLVHQRGTGAPSSADDGLRTLATGGGRGGDHVGVAAAWLTKYYGSEGQHQSAGDGLDTLSTADRFAVTSAALAEPPLSPEQYARARQVAEFLRRHDAWDGGDLVTIAIPGGGCWIVVDLGMRMLKPHEAAAAHGLTLPAAIFVDGKWRPLNKTEAMRLVGNSVPPLMAQLLAEANAAPAHRLFAEAAE